MKYRILTRDEAKPLIEAKRLRGAYLHEPQHAKKGTVFVYVQLTKDMRCLYRVLSEDEASAS